MCGGLRDREAGRELADGQIRAQGGADQEDAALERDRPRATTEWLPQSRDQGIEARSSEGGGDEHGGVSGCECQSHER